MPLESGTYISDLVASNPVGATDPKSQGDDHIRLIKSTIKNTFPNITGAVTATHTQLNVLAGTTNDRVVRVTGGALNLGQLTSGMFPSQVVPDAALSTNVPLKTVSNTFTEPQTIVRSSGAGLTLAKGIDIDRNFLRWNQGSAWWQAGFRGGPYTWVLEYQTSGSTPSDNTGWTQFISVNPATSTITLNGVNVADYARLSAVGDGLQVAGNGYAVNSTVVRTSGDQSISGTKTFTGTLALAGTISGNVSTPNSSASEVGFKGAPHRDITASTSTQASDAGGTIKMISGSGTLTLNSNPPADSVIVIYNKSGNNWTIAASGTLRWATTGGTGNRTLAPHGLAVAYHDDGGGTWVINGGGLS